MLIFLPLAAEAVLIAGAFVALLATDLVGVAFFTCATVHKVERANTLTAKNLFIRLKNIVGVNITNRLITIAIGAVNKGILTSIVSC